VSDHNSSRWLRVPSASSSAKPRSTPMTAPLARSKGGGDAADVAPVDRAVGHQKQDVAGQHVHPTQAAPTLRPDRPFTVVSHGVGHLLSSHGRASSSMINLRSSRSYQDTSVPRANSTARVRSTWQRSDRPRAMGLWSMRERTEMLGRNLRIDSERVVGTRVEMRGYPSTEDSGALAKGGLSRRSKRGGN
jgi:hypothetical protein